MLSSGVLLVYFAYQFQDTYHLDVDYQYVGFSGVLVTALVSLFFVSDSFRRLNKCLEHHDRLGITRRQILLNISIFFVCTLSLAALMGSVVQISIASGIEAKLNSLNYMILFDGISLGCTTVSSLPVVYIVNSLINKAVEYEEEQNKV